MRNSPYLVLGKHYTTPQKWKGPIGGPYSFDDNGDVAGNFELFEVQDGASKKIQG